jgi:hypothetical protein
MTNSTLVSTFTNFITIVVGVAFLGVATVGIVSPVHAQTTVSTSTAR